MAGADEGIVSEAVKRRLIFPLVLVWVLGSVLVFLCVCPHVSGRAGHGRAGEGSLDGGMGKGTGWLGSELAVMLMVFVVMDDGRCGELASCVRWWWL